MSTPAVAQPADQLEQPLDAFGVGPRIEQLAADVHRDGVERQQRMLAATASASGTTWSTGIPNLIPPCAGRDEGMGVGGDVGIDPDADADRPSRQPRGDPAERGQLGGGLEVDVADAGLDRRRQLRRRSCRPR